MANKQALPNGLLSANVGDISSPAPNRVVAPEWKEQKFKIASNLAKGVVGISASYKDMKHTEMLAKLDNVQQQNLHALGDATDPCQLPELVKQANESYDTMFKDDYYGKSFYESEVYKKFKQSNELKVQQKVQEMNHKFAGIQAVATGNEISSDIALMTDPNRMSGALRTYEAMLSQMELTADEKFRIMSEVTKSAFGKVLANNPNNAVAWYNASQGAYDKYGVNGADLMDKAKQKNIQNYRLLKSLEDEKRKEEKEARQQAKDDAESSAYSTALNYKLGNINADDVYLKAKELDSLGFSQEAYTLVSKAFPQNKTETQKQIATQKIGDRINNLGNINDEITKKAEIELIEMEIEENRNLGYVSDSLYKQWKNSLTSKSKEDILSDIKTKAETGSMNNDDFDFLDDLVASEKITTTQREAIVRKNERNLDIAKYENKILNDNITTHSEIDALDISNEQKVSLKNILNKHRTDMGYDTEYVEDAYRAINSGEYENVLKSLLKIPESKRQPILDKWKAKIQSAQVENYEMLQGLLAEGDITLADVESEYQNRNINFTQYKTLKDTIIANEVNRARTEASEIAQKIINGDIRTQGQLDEVYNDVSTSTPYYLTNYNALRALLDDKSKPYWEVLNRAYNTIDNFLKKDAFGNNTTIAIKNSAEAKRQLLLIFNQQMDNKNITIDKMMEIFSPDRVTALAQVYAVDFNDLSQAYKDVGQPYNKEAFVKALGDIDLNNIQSLDVNQFIKIQDSDEEQSETKNKSVIEKIGGWIDSVSGYLKKTTPRKESEKSSDINKAMLEVDNIEFDDGLLKEGL